MGGWGTLTIKALILHSRDANRGNELRQEHYNTTSRSPGSQRGSV